MAVTTRYLAALVAAVLLWLPTMAPRALADALPAGEAHLLEGLQAARAADGAEPLHPDARLAGVARAWSERMRDDYHAAGSGAAALRHNPDVFDQIPGSFGRAAENVGYASGGTDTVTLAERVLEGFLDSAGHRANIVEPAFTLVGVGLAQAGDGALFATVVFSDGSPPAPAEEPEVTSQAPEPDSEPAGIAARPDDPVPSRDRPVSRPAAPPPSPELFGDGWPEGYLSPGPRQAPTDLLALVRWRPEAFALTGLGLQ